MQVKMAHLYNYKYILEYIKTVGFLKVFVIFILKNYIL